MRKRQDNRGSSLIVVIIVIAFVSLLVATLFMMSVINIQMKSVDRSAKENFYSAEGALEQITIGLQKELSDVSSNAYTMIMQQYANNTLEVERRRIFNGTLLADLKGRLQGDEANGKYDKDVLFGYLSDDIKGYVTLESNDWKLLPETLEVDSDSLLLKGLIVTFTDASGYQSVIETDIRLTAPNLNLVQPSDMPEVFDYSIIANEQLISSVPGNVKIKAGVYAGEQGLTLTNGSDWDFEQAHRLVVKGDVKIPAMASLSTTDDMDLWARELDVSGGALAAGGRTYVSNDLTLSGRGSHVTLEGEYYGYGNGDLSTGGDSSAILINGTNSTLDMSDMRRLLLSGSAQIATSKQTFDQDHIDSLLPENDPSLNDLIENATLAQGSYYMKSVGNGLLVCSADNYLRAQTSADYKVVSGSYERLLLIHNNDGTISLMDPNNPKHKNMYISVQTDNQNILLASAQEVGVNEKFYLYSYTKNNINYYALQSYANGKFVSIDTYYPVDGGDSVAGVLCANRDKVTDDAQLFLISHWGELPSMAEEKVYEPTVSFTYDGADQVSIEFGYVKWGATVPKDEKAGVKYTVLRGGKDVANSNNAYKEMNQTTLDRRLYYNISDLQVGDKVEYTIRYTDDAADGGYKYTSGVYTHRPGYGNTPSDEVELVDGIYSIRCVAFTGASYIQRDNELVFKCVTDSHTESDGSWEEFHIVNNHDGTISFKSIMTMDRYLSVQEDGSLKTTAYEIGVNEKFILEPVDGDEDCYRLKTPAGGIGNGKYLYVNRSQVIIPELNNNWVCVADEDDVSAEDESKGHFSFNWLRVTFESGQEPEPEPEPENYNPVTHMDYKSETSAEVTFTSPYWTDSNAGTVTLYYEINGSPTYTPITMNISGTEATCIVPNLRNQNRVTYRFEYTYSGKAEAVSTSTYVYVHETVYGEGISTGEENPNINLGESIEVKSNQIAYLVPAECIGVNNGETLIGKNPLSEEEFKRLLSYVNNTSQYPNFEIVSFTKEVEDLGSNLGTYRTAGTDGYKTVFVQTTSGTMVYFYVDFDSDKTSEYFRDYYEKNQSALEQYMGNYINEIRLSNRFTRLTTHGNMVFSSGGSTGKIDLRADSYPETEELSGLRNEEGGYRKRFDALSTKLMLDYDDLSTVEKSRNLFDNLVRYSETGGDADAQAFPYTGNIPLSYMEPGAVAIFVNNAGEDSPYRYNAENDPNDEICLILATGDVVLEKDFSGVVIARGTVTVANGVHQITPNQEDLYRVLKHEMDSGETLLEYFFRDGDKYILESNNDAVISVGDYISYADLITYEEWTKR